MFDFFSRLNFQTPLFKGFLLILIFQSSFLQASLSSDKDLVSVGSSVSLSWSSSSSCSAYDDWSGSKGQSGTEEVTISKGGWNIFSLNCQGSYENVYVYGTLFSTGVEATPTKKTMFENFKDALTFIKPTEDVTFSIVDSSNSMDDALFTLSSSGLLSFISYPDFEDPKDVGADNTYNIQVSASNGTTSNVKDFQIIIEDYNDVPSSISLSSTTVTENTIGSVIGTISVSDDDILTLTKSASKSIGSRSDDTISLVISGADGDLFEIPSASITAPPETLFGSLRFKRNAANGSLISPDYESKSTYNITITATDSGSSPNSTVLNPKSFSKDFAITVTNQDEPVTGVSLSSLTVDENVTAGSLIASISAITEDITDTHTYTLSGTDASSFVISGSSLLLASSVSPDYETKSSYSVTLTASDVANSSASTAFTISVNDVPEYPNATNTPYATIDENGTAVGTLTASDNNSDLIAYSIGSGLDGSLFSINQEGALIFTRAPDYETPLDSDLDNVYEVPIVLGNGSYNTYVTYYVTVSDVEEIGGIELASKVSTVKTQKEE